MLKLGTPDTTPTSTETNTTPPVATTPPAQTPPTEWYGSLPEPIRQNPNVVKYKSIEDLANGHINLVKKLGERGPQPPEDHSKYTWEPDKAWNLDAAAIDEAKKFAFSLGLDDIRAKAALDHYHRTRFEAAQQSEAQLQQEAEATYSQTVRELQEEWGPMFTQNAAKAENVLALKPELKELCQAEGLQSSKPFIKYLLSLSSTLAQPGPSAPPAQTTGVASGSVQQQIDSLMQSKAFTDPSDPGNAAAKAKLIELYRLRYPSAE